MENQGGILQEDPRWRLWALLNHARDALVKARDKELARHGVSTRQAAVLYAVKVLGDEAIPAEIAKWVLREPHSVSGILNRLIKHGLLEKSRDPKRKGQIKVSLTEKGHRVLGKATDRESVYEVLSCVSDKEYECVSEVLSRITDDALKLIATMNRPPFLR